MPHSKKILLVRNTVDQHNQRIALEDEAAGGVTVKNWPRRLQRHLLTPRPKSKMVGSNLDMNSSETLAFYISKIQSAPLQTSDLQDDGNIILNIIDSRVFDFEA